MSRLVVDQIQDVDKTNLVEVDTLGQYINTPETIPVKSSGSETDRTLGNWTEGLAYAYGTVSDMSSDTALKEGSFVCTLGYAESGDGGGGFYKIVPSDAGRNVGFLFEDLAAVGLQAQLLSGGLIESKSVKIPTDYPSYQSAIDDLSKLTHNQGVVIDLVGESGWQPDSGISVSDGDYSHFKISHEDDIPVLDAGFPAVDFIKGENARMPVLNCLVDAQGRCETGYYAINTSSGVVSENCGVKNAGAYGLFANDNSFVFANYTVWTGASQSSLQYAGILAWGSRISAEGADTSDSLYYGAQAAAGGVLSFRDGISNNTGRYGIRATNNGSIDARRAQVSGNALYGIYAFRGSRINAMGAVANNNASANVYASSLSFINFSEDTLGQSCDGGGSIAQIYATGGSVVECSGVVLTNGVAIAIKTETGAEVIANVSNISGYATIALETNAGKISVDSSVIDGAGSSSRIIECRGGVVSARSASITNSPVVAVRVSDAGTVNLTSGATIDGSPVTTSDINGDTLNGFQSGSPSFGIVWA